MSAAVNFILTRTKDKVRAVCEFCDRRSAPVRMDYDGGPCMWSLPNGWSCAPYPSDFAHPDGSTGDLWACPACNKKLHAGEPLRVHETRAAAYVLVAT